MQNSISTQATRFAAHALFGLFLFPTVVAPLHATPIVQTSFFASPEAIDLFDPNLGTLQSVAIEFNYTATASFGIRNPSLLPIVVTYIANLSVLITEPPFSIFGSGNLVSNYTVAPNGTSLFPFIAFATATITGGGFFDSTTALSLFTSESLQFIPTNNHPIFNLAAPPLAPIVLTGDTTFSPNSDGFFRVTYDFEPAQIVVNPNPPGPSPQELPEPSTFALFGLALAGLVGLRRRKQRAG